MRYISIDLGDKRTGIAAGDAVTRLVSPVGVLQTPLAHGGGESLLEAIAAASEEQLGPPARPGFRGTPGEIVVGLPVNMDGTEGPRAKVVRAFAQRIATRTGRVVHLQDERLTSSAADWAMARTGMTYKEKKERRDALAAAAILNDFLSGGSSGADPEGAQDR
jgi:putative holliday junction resolvase